MKALVFVALCWVVLVACGPNSSPEGRTGLKIDRLKQSIDSLKLQNQALQDSLHQLSLAVRALKK